ncbi:hypothetical protein AB0L54_33295 [Streptomyces sp. NPDC052196]|uniref:hypothetical protein n=1 Tax=Streptomyces sp. NPDC052196 TaxID=3156691 RepID=UPI0034454526
MEVATIRRDLNGTLTELERAVERFDVAKAVDLFQWAWHQASQAPPRETREQRTQLKNLKETLHSRRWRDEERRQAAQQEVRRQLTGAQPIERPRLKKRSASPKVSAAQSRTVWSSDVSSNSSSGPTVQRSRSGSPVSATQVRPDHQDRRPGLLEAGRLAELATDLRPLLEQTAQAGTTITWAAIRRRLPALPRHRDDESALLWLVDDDGEPGEPLLSALVTVGDRHMHPRFPVIAEQLGLHLGSVPAQQRASWSYEVLRVHQHWRHKR